MNLLTRLRELSEKATKGPWEVTDDGCYLLSSTEYDVSEICEMTLSNHPDSELIALMRNNIDKLLDVVAIAKKYDSDMCFCDDELFNTGGGMCTQCALHQAFEALERE